EVFIIGFLGRIKAGLKAGWKTISGILVKAPIPAHEIELKVMLYYIITENLNFLLWLNLKDI
ncbi:unnamed protein product, partial [marine sediment metagenome]